MCGDYYTFVGFNRKTSPWCGEDKPFSGTIFDADMPTSIKKEWVKRKGVWSFETIVIQSEHLYDTNGLLTNKFCRLEKRYTRDEEKIGVSRIRYL